jgi:hypothetical protein
MQARNTHCSRGLHWAAVVHPVQKLRVHFNPRLQSASVVQPVATHFPVKVLQRWPVGQSASLAQDAWFGTQVPLWQRLPVGQSLSVVQGGWSLTHWPVAVSQCSPVWHLTPWHLSPPATQAPK